MFFCHACIMHTKPVSYLPDHFQAQYLQFYMWEIFPRLLSGKQHVRYLQAYAHNRL